ncbi:MAG: DUF3135 domain-containing protein [Candidatus Thiodiazotropha sp. (ex Lucinoma kastoroae)]|nr:DUF3135 domain-containing protein [Candidatus Thiodiazotropha sp. (ex Rostrolucina anterorostrata)]MCU7848837.1 DUF3135 domain-containing protein [Candidatus Thiodiazotropha sp. (ex Lucinoma kastoroae)]
MTQSNNRKFDFDHFLNLAKGDPLRFEDMRQEAIDDFIATLPVDRQQRMRQLQWRIDQERRNRSPLSACLKISSMMWEHMVGPQGLLGYLRGEVGVKEGPISKKGIVVDFPIQPSR